MDRGPSKPPADKGGRRILDIDRRAYAYTAHIQNVAKVKTDAAVKIAASTKRVRTPIPPINAPEIPLPLFH